MKNRYPPALGTALLPAANVTHAQNAQMMDGGMWNAAWMGGYGGIWVPVLLVVIVVGALAWAFSRRGGGSGPK